MKVQHAFSFFFFRFPVVPIGRAKKSSPMVIGSMDTKVLGDKVLLNPTTTLTYFNDHTSESNDHNQSIHANTTTQKKLFCVCVCVSSSCIYIHINIYELSSYIYIHMNYHHICIHTYIYVYIHIYVYKYTFNILLQGRILGKESTYVYIHIYMYINIYVQYPTSRSDPW